MYIMCSLRYNFVGKYYARPCRLISHTEVNKYVRIGRAENRFLCFTVFFFSVFFLKSILHSLCPLLLFYFITAAGQRCVVTHILKRKRISETVRLDTLHFSFTQRQFTYLFLLTITLYLLSVSILVFLLII